eukprot:GFUD01020792.1.p1 GENE.GFUD01020792.1~~GFUD01020792.1.p1  ORF type:complete len:769 (+),score=201.03 GFUD01020792.1:62-2308(+)
MNCLFVFSVFISVSLAVPLPSPDAEPEADASPAAYASDYTYYVPAQEVLEPPSSQYHAQDDIGQYNFGFSSPDQTKQEVKTADGVVRGAYSYVDANGIVQSVNYIADALGFRVAATNLPVHDVPAAHVVAVAASQAVQPAPVVAVSSEAVMTPKIDYAYLPYAQAYDYHVAPTQYVQAVQAVQAAPVVQVQAAAPVVQNTQYIQYAAAPVVQATPIVQTTQHVQAPVVQAAPVVPVSVEGTQYHAQDAAGQYSFGYNDPNSVRQEVKTADGVVRGAYRYVDTNGIVQTVEYIADAAGFRVAGTNLPVGVVELPVPVQDTPEVAAAKQAHFEAFGAAAAAAAVQPEIVSYNAEPLPIVASVPIPVVAPSPSPVVFSEPTPILSVEAPQLSVNIPVPTNYAPVSNVASIPAFESLPPVATYSQQIYYGAAAAPATITYAQAPVSVVNSGAAAPTTVTYVQAPVVAAPVVVAAAAEGSQYHAQDDFGQYSFGYSDGNSVKQEIKTADGVVRGAYSYVDSDGIIQTVNYIADAMGFRVGATNLPVHHVEGPVAEVAAVPVAAPAPVVAAYNTPVIAPEVSYSYLPYATNYGYNLPVAAVNQPVVAEKAAAPVKAVASPVYAAGVPIVASTIDAANSQYHAQDDLGQYNYGFSHPTQTKQELKTADGVTRGSYSYVDANGLVQTVNYISDAMGFRVAATNLPVHHIDGNAVDTPVAVATPNNVISPAVEYSYLPYATNYGYTSQLDTAAAAAA